MSIRSMFAAAMTCCQLSISELEQLLNSSGVEGFGSLPSSLSRSTIAGSARTCLNSTPSRSNIGPGKFASVTRPCHPVTSYPGKPLSATVGRLTNRVPPVTATAQKTDKAASIHCMALWGGLPIGFDDRRRRRVPPPIGGGFARRVTGAITSADPAGPATLSESNVVSIRRSVILIGAAALCGVIGFIVPQFFDRDVGGALASAIFGMIGLAVGVVIGAVITRWRP